MNRTDHLLVILAEEANEVAHRVAKALRFGLQEVQEGQAKTNAERIVDELTDMLAVMEMLAAEGPHILDPTGPMTDERIARKKERVEEYLLLSERLGRLDVPADPLYPSGSLDAGAIVVADRDAWKKRALASEEREIAARAEERAAARVLIEKEAKAHDELAEKIPSGPDRMKAATLRRFAEVFLPL